MSPEPINQQDPDTFYEIVPEANQETIDTFLQQLEGQFDYPAFVHMSETPEEEVVDEPNDDEPEEVETSEETDDHVDEPTTQPDTVVVNGNAVPLSDVQRLYEFDQYLRQNPDAAQRVQQAVTPQPAVTPPVQPQATEPASQELTPPDFLDMEDPAHKFMWESHVAQQRQLATFQQQQAIREQEEINRRAMLDMDTALASFRAAHPTFNDDQIGQLRRHAASMNIITPMLATSSDPVTALVRVMDVAALDHPDLRTVYLAPTDTPSPPTRQQRNKSRQSKLNSLGGSSGSAPRTTSTPRPSTDREAREQFAAGLAESLGLN